jgi:hypothetical protein
MPERISETEYYAAFSTVATGDSPRKAALESALDIRKFEIQLYWTRAAYFWTFSAVTLGAYGGLQTVVDEPKRLQLSVLVCCIGLVFAFAWHLANRGSKHWQENWERHVDLLESDITGPLYKIVIRRTPPRGLRQRVARVISGPGPYSVSKINQIVSLYICSVWVMLLGFALARVFSLRSKLPMPNFLVPLLATVAALWLMVQAGRTERNDLATTATLRDARFENRTKERELTLPNRG